MSPLLSFLRIPAHIPRCFLNKLPLIDQMRFHSILHAVPNHTSSKATEFARPRDFGMLPKRATGINASIE